MSVSGRVGVVSPHLLVAQAVAAALRSVGTSAEAMAWETPLVAGAPPGRVTPRFRQLVVITDGLDNDAVIAHVRRHLALGRVRVLVVTSAEGAVRWGRLLESEQLDVLTQTTTVAQLAEAVDLLAAGRAVMDPERRTALRTAWALTVDRQQRLKALMATLSPQQHRVLELLATGRRVSEVGTELGVSSGTVRSHVKSLRAKLGAPTQLKAVAMYHQAHEGVLPVDLVPTPRQVDEDVGPRVGAEVDREGGGPGAERPTGTPGEVSGGAVTLARR
jgi:DNA-binding NarL/FixJ family response regulator